MSFGLQEGTDHAKSKLSFTQAIDGGARRPHVCLPSVHSIVRRLAHGYVSCIVQVLVLSHEDATRTEQLPYLRVRLRPIPVLDFFGRAAKRDPPCHPRHCVWYWWKEPVGKERRWVDLGSGEGRGKQQ